MGVGLVVVYGWACWRGSTVAVVILGLFLFVFEFGGLRIDGGREIFFLSCFLNCFKLQMFKRITSPTPAETTVMKSQWGDWASAPKAIGCSFSKSKRSRLQGRGDWLLRVRL